MLTAVLIALNEEGHIDDCLSRLGFCDEIVVVDSGSTDRTCGMAAARGARVTQRTFTDFADQKNAAIGLATGEWVLLIDADERVGPELAEEIRRAIADTDATGYWLERENWLFGRRMRHGGNSGDKQLRLVRKRAAHFEGAVHERITTIPGERYPLLRNKLEHRSTPSVSDYMRKLNLYTRFDARTLNPGASRSTTSAKILFRSAGVVLRRAILQRAYLDGPEGMLFAALSGYYEFVRQIKSWESARARSSD